MGILIIATGSGYGTCTIEVGQNEGLVIPPLYLTTSLHRRREQLEGLIDMDMTNSVM